MLHKANKFVWIFFFFNLTASFKRNRLKIVTQNMMQVVDMLTNVNRNLTATMVFLSQTFSYKLFQMHDSQKI